MLREGRAERRSQAAAQTSNRRIRDQPLSRPHGASRVPAVGGATGGRSSHVRPGVPECGPIIRPSKTSRASFFFFCFLMPTRSSDPVSTSIAVIARKGSTGGGAALARHSRVERTHPKRNRGVNPYWRAVSGVVESTRVLHGCRRVGFGCPFRGASGRLPRRHAEFRNHIRDKLLLAW